ncbi:hypothetical protein CSUI_003679, partial [Cystoisospora suis]
MSQPTSPTISPSTPVGGDAEERQLEIERSPTEGPGYVDNETRSLGDHSIGVPSQAGPAKTNIYVPTTDVGQGRMLLPTMEPIVAPPGQQQMMWFNPAGSGYTNTSRGYDPREGYPLIY